MRWLSYVFLTSNYRAYIEVHATGTSGSMKNLSKSQLKAMPLAFPQLNEQKLIAERLAKADEIIATEFMKSVKLKAEKSGLMDDLLTGRVRVKPLMSEAAQQPGST
jgi:type I restriction enzyme S subunit